MNAPVRTDEITGLKIFNTRAAKATDKITGKGYSAIDDQALKVLPPPPPGAKFNAEEQAKYRAFKEARRGAADYMAMEGEFSRYLDDVYSTPPVPREPLTDRCEVLVIGAGFAGLLLWYKLSQAGFDDVRFCEKGGDVGGTWYWNRYPGIACDVESYSYFPLLEEMGYFPTMKFASGFEIFEYCQKMAEKFGFYEHCLFHTTVERTEWDEASGRWTVSTDRGDAMKARYVVVANGILTTPKLARINGMETFQGESFHTSRWNYDVDLAGKRSGIIGTGATAVQAIPSWPRWWASSSCSSGRRPPSTCATSGPPRPRRSHSGGTNRAGRGPGGPWPTPARSSRWRARPRWWRAGRGRRWWTACAGTRRARRRLSPVRGWPEWPSRPCR